MAQPSASQGWTYRPATIYQHSATAGLLATPIRAYQFARPSIFAETHVDEERQEVCLLYMLPQSPKLHLLWIRATNQSYVTIEVEDVVLYDSREDLPIDMTAWTALNNKQRGGRRPRRL